MKKIAYIGVGNYTIELWSSGVRWNANAIRDTNTNANAIGNAVTFSASSAPGECHARF